MDFLQFEKKASKRAAFVFAMAAKVDRIGKDSPVQQLAQDKYLLQYLVGFIRDRQHEHIMTGAGHVRILSMLTNKTLDNDCFCLPSATDIRFAPIDRRNGDREIFIFGRNIRDCREGVACILKISTEWSSLNSLRSECRFIPFFHGDSFWNFMDIVAVDENVYFFNKKHGFVAINVFSTTQMQWITETRLPTVREHPGIAVVGKRIFVIGGLHMYSVLSIVEVFDTETKKWSTLPPLNNCRRDMEVVVTEDRYIWVLGGSLGSFYEPKTIEIFDTAKIEAWRSVEIKFPSLAGMTAVPLDRKIYICSCDLIKGALDVDKMEYEDFPLEKIYSSERCSAFSL